MSAIQAEFDQIEAAKSEADVEKKVIIKDPGAPITNRQLYAVHLLTKLETRDLQISKDEASPLIDQANQGVSLTLSAKQKKGRKKN